ncbi:Flp family type IVb pilin [Vibrio sp. AND4]|uniref:Flp family type IVb pilin n=1 Tax=Vibrio sp. AND4 TaxID=314289 RepID=UPI00015EFF9E|nr:Flp family type IVb pilin [Vibrio sp. AND4]EDP59399.1 hypothetical protein AND4_09507 [Vibrio sp. AND4]
MITKLYVKTKLFLSEFNKDERGVTAIEYGLIAVAMAVVLGLALGTDGFIGQLDAAFDEVESTIQGVLPTT